MTDSACCSPSAVNDLDKHFDRQRAEEDAADYLENGLGERGEKLLAHLDTHTPGFRDALDIGCGAGALHQEMLLRGLVKRATAVDGSQAFLEAARQNAASLELDGRVDYLHHDFALDPGAAPAADVVLLDRVLCCYPELDGLLAPAAQKARHYLVLSYPSKAPWVRLLFLWLAFKKALTRSKFRLYYHEPRRIEAILREAGLQPVFEDRVDEWQLGVYQRAPAA